jgi:hypothetical protein
MEDEVADGAMLNAASNRLQSSKDAAAVALGMLCQWAKDAEASDDGDAGGLSLRSR